ncbi:ParA family protein [Methylogaea oryzae]|uniref:Cobyric acid synthase n=1 Tax=Methylogaea oryzae TaxID=1295382 RepID=A0A8D5AMW5_9GAMM|nr:ParA family protein [Methylogaea oryzae]BBL71490.1 cobyric acid synthase [Methylogaea oryzae]
MKIWTVSNQKGGVGKTTTVVTLGGILAAWGFRTLLIDLDPHGSLTSYFRLNPDEIKISAYNLFQDAGAKKAVDPRRYVVETAFDGLQLLPASPVLATLDRQAGAMDGMGLVIAASLGAVSDDFDFILIDSPPMLGVLMVNALAACDRLIMPVLAEYLAFKGLERMLRTVDMIGRSRRKPIDYLVLPTMFDRRTKESQESLQMLQERCGNNLWRSVIPVDTRLRDASRAGVPPVMFAAHSKAVLAYSEFLEFLLHE